MSGLNPIGSSIVVAAIHLASDMIDVPQSERAETYKQQLDHVLNRYSVEGAEGKGAVEDIAAGLMTFAQRIAKSAA